MGLRRDEYVIAFALSFYYGSMTLSGVMCKRNMAVSQYSGIRLQKQGCIVIYLTGTRNKYRY